MMVSLIVKKKKLNNILTEIQLIVIWWYHMATQICGNIGSDNSFSPDSTKPLPEPMLMSHWWGSVAITCEQFDSQWLYHYSVLWLLNIILSNLPPRLPKANELTLFNYTRLIDTSVKGETQLHDYSIQAIFINEPGQLCYNTQGLALLGKPGKSF